MITIYSVDSEGRLFTDEKQHFYIDSKLLREKAAAVRTEYLLNRIAKAVGYKDFSSLDAYLRCSGITASTLESWILSGKLIENIT